MSSDYDQRHEADSLRYRLEHAVELTEPERNQVAASLRETAARMERQSRGRDNAGPRYEGLRRMLRDEARAMRELAARFDGSTR